MSTTQCPGSSSREKEGMIGSLSIKFCYCICTSKTSHVHTMYRIQKTHTYISSNRWRENHPLHAYIHTFTFPEELYGRKRDSRLTHRNQHNYTAITEVDLSQILLSQLAGVCTLKTVLTITGCMHKKLEPNCPSLQKHYQPRTARLLDS